MILRSALLLALFVSSVSAQEVAGALKCSCRDHHPTYASLGCPRKPPADPTFCEVAEAGLSCKGWKPPDKPGLRAASMESFLLRHAVAWGIECSVCAETKIQKGRIREFHAEAAALAAEEKKFGGRRMEVARSPHYVIVSDLPPLKIKTAGGGIRIADKHELLHLYLQRAEQAREDFVQVFGEPRVMRSLMVLVHSEGTRTKYSARIFGNSGTNLLYGGGSGNKLGGAGNGFCLSGRDDDDLHFNCRHMVGHLCISTYGAGGPYEKHLPQWIFRGAAHWLCKIHPRAADHAYFCSYEGVTVSGSGARWDDKARKIAARGPQRDPVEAMFQASTAKLMNFQMHVRAWSWFDVFTREEREPFVAFVQKLRAAKEARVAAKEAWGQPPEYVDDRWRERVLGKRRDVTASTREMDKETEIDAASARELRGIANESDLQLLASKIRGLERCQNVKTARLLVSLLDSRGSPRVQEVIALVLNRTTDAEVLDYLRGDGYRRAGTLGKATLCRVFGETKARDAVPLLRDAMDDGNWLVKANAMRALALIGDTESIPAVAQAATSGQGIVRIAAMNSLGRFGAAAADTIPLWERNLMDSKWQVKVATCAAFRAIGSTKAMDMLIGRVASEGGRVHDEIRTTIRDLTGMDRDWSQEEWRKWWTHMKGFRDLEKKMKEQLEAERARKEREAARPQDGNRTVAGPGKTKPPTYYGIKVYARAVGYVIDHSLSMEQGFRVSQGWQDRLGRTYTATSRMGVVKEEIAQAIKELDPRTRINLVFFNTRVRTWKSAPVAAGAMGDNAISAVRNLTPEGQTNYYDALREVLQLGEGSGWRAAFADTPDTLFFLTDGHPTDGEITKADELLGWWNERNRFARLRVHVIAMGNTGVDAEFLRRFAETNDGKFVHMTGSH